MPQFLEWRLQLSPSLLPTTNTLEPAFHLRLNSVDYVDSELDVPRGGTTTDILYATVALLGGKLLAQLAKVSRLIATTVARDRGGAEEQV